jgi:hypothetical protein
MECARSMILAQGLELEFWGEMVNTIGIRLEERDSIRIRREIV